LGKRHSRPEPLQQRSDSLAIPEIQDIAFSTLGDTNEVACRNGRGTCAGQIGVRGQKVEYLGRLAHVSSCIPGVSLVQTDWNGCRMPFVSPVSNSKCRRLCIVLHEPHDSAVEYSPRILLHCDAQ